MQGVLRPVTALLLATAIAMAGHGILVMLLPLKASAAAFSSFEIGLMGSGYFAGLVGGCLLAPAIITRVGHIRAFSAFTASVCNLRPESRGHVRIKSTDPAAAPEIQLNYLSADKDKHVAADAIRLTRRIVLETEAMKPYQPEEFMPGLEAQSDADLVKAAGDIGTTIYHPVSTCKMGSDSDAVVDDQLRVHGIEGLRVADASIMPTITSGNTNSPTLMIAEKAAAMVRDAGRG